MIRIALVVVFQDEERLLPTFLASLEGQSRQPDEVVLVDDGSTDASPEIAAAFAGRNPRAHVERRPPRPPEPDRLMRAAEFVAFLRGVDSIRGHYDVVAKMDGDLRLGSDLLASIEHAMSEDHRLGMVGPYLSIETDRGSTVRERCPPYHVRGPARFYRRECLKQIMPIEPILGWDVFDEAKARMHGWKTMSIAPAGGDSIHLRPVGTGDGAMRGYVRRGVGMYAAGASPLWVLLGGLVRMVRERPRVVVGATWILGYAIGSRRGIPRASREVRGYLRSEQRARMRAALGATSSLLLATLRRCPLRCGSHFAPR